MDKRIDYYSASKEAMETLISLESSVLRLGLEPRLVSLVKLRASQINACSFCVDLHTSEARRAGESERRLYAVSAWRETPFFSARERAALAWTEAITLIAQTQAPDADYKQLAAHFNEKEMTDLTLAIATINVWNRLAIGFRKMPTL
ncbi:carboxymuconolactone decarboxylase family protein [Massilia niastensis]|uniref:carboxymuconolactone decarboxylase family protein n=1 Tax=Massilia niastensis TaxID=544911 RepID=UPI000362E93B|nr:carboxymuconolactone decarboxylase family protein [Massilia niastensis]